MLFRMDVYFTPTLCTCLSFSVYTIIFLFNKTIFLLSRTYLKIEIEAELSYSYCDGEVDRRAMGTNSGALS